MSTILARSALGVGLLMVWTVVACAGNNSPTSAPGPTPTPTIQTFPSPQTAPDKISETITATPSLSETATPSGTLADLPAEVASAFEKTKNATKIRYEMSSKVTFVQDGKLAEQPGMSAQGEGNGADQHISISGMMNATGQIATFEIITLDGETYIKGLAGIPGIDSSAWYKFPKELGSVSKDAPTAKTLLGDLDLQDFQRGEFKKSGTETLDGQTCAVWSAQNAQLAQNFGGLANSAEAERQLERIDSAEFKLWTCPDGYMHQLGGLIKGHNPKNPSEQATVELKFHLFDFDAAIIITAPPDAREFQLPQRPPPGTPPP